MIPSGFASVVAGALAWASACADAFGQLLPERTYYGAGRAVPMTARAPRPETPAAGQGESSAGELRVRLIDPKSGEVVTSAVLSLASAAGEDVGLGSDVAAAGDRVIAFDLAERIPSFWKQAAQRALRAQLVIGTRACGPSVVLQPMVTPAYAPRADRAGVPMFPPEKERSPVFSGVRAYVDRDVELQTSLGRIVIALRPESAPNTCWRFRELVAGGFYTDVIVHRIASLAGRSQADIIQTGDPNGNGQGGCGEFLDLEPSDLPHDFGVVSMARFGDPNSAGSQFMIGLNREGTAYLDRRYAAFGVVIAGADVVRAIAASPVGPDYRPKDPPVIRSARLIDAAPFGEAPPPEKDPVKREGR